MTLDELIEALTALRSSDEIGALPVHGIQPDSGFSDYEVAKIYVMLDGDSACAAPHIRLDQNYD